MYECLASKLYSNCEITTKKVHVIHNGLFHANLFNLSKEYFCSTPKHGHCEVCFNLPTFFQRKLCLLKYSFEISFELSAVFKSTALFEYIAFESSRFNLYHFLFSRPFAPFVYHDSIFFSQILPPILWRRDGELIGLLTCFKLHLLYKSMHKSTQTNLFTLIEMRCV